MSNSSEDVRSCIYDGYNEYKVYADGRVMGTKGKFRTLWLGRGGYLKVALWNKGTSKVVYVHRLVCACFKLNPLNKKEVNHIDGDKLNNHISNLEWVTSSENHRHAVKTGLMPPVLGEKNGKHKLKVVDVLSIRSSNLSWNKLAKQFGVTKSAIQHVKERRNWKQVEVAHV